MIIFNIFILRASICFVESSSINQRHVRHHHKTIIGAIKAKMQPLRFNNNAISFYFFCPGTRNFFPTLVYFISIKKKKETRTRSCNVTTFPISARAGCYLHKWTVKIPLKRPRFATTREDSLPLQPRHLFLLGIKRPRSQWESKEDLHSLLSLYARMALRTIYILSEEASIPATLACTSLQSTSF